jgi:seryl-tRNA synthetase
LRSATPPRRTWAAPRRRATRRNSNACARWWPKRRTRSPRLEEEAKEKDAALRDLLSGIPNLPYDDVPDGADEDDNVEIHRWGTPREFDFTPKEHFELTGARPAWISRPPRSSPAPASC